VTTLFIVDDRTSVRQALAQRLERVPGLHVVGSAGSSQDGIARIHATRPDVVLLELKLADGRGMEMLRTVRADLPDTRVLILTSYLDEFERQVALKAGADEYMLKDIDTEKLTQAILSSDEQRAED